MFFCIKSKSRLYTGCVTAIFCGMLSFTYLDPLLSEIGLVLATVAFHILVILETLVGMSICVLLPKLCVGDVLGATSLFPNGCYFKQRVSRVIYI